LQYASNLLGDRLPHVRDRAYPGVIEVPEFIGEPTDRARGFLVRTRFEGVLRDDRQEVGELGQHARDVVVGTGHASVASSEIEQDQEKRLLRMETILRLVPDRRTRSVDDLIGYLLTAMRRQTVQDDRRRVRQIEQRLVHLIGTEHEGARVSLFLLTHARPYVGVK